MNSHNCLNLIEQLKHRLSHLQGIQKEIQTKPCHPSKKQTIEAEIKTLQFQLDWLSEKNLNSSKPSQKTKKIKCPSCDWGVVKVLNGNIVSCRHCDGTGELKQLSQVEKTEVIEICVVGKQTEIEAAIKLLRDNFETTETLVYKDNSSQEKVRRSLKLKNK